MTDARVERIEPDPLLAADFLDQAKSFAADGAPNTLSAASRQVLLHSSVVAACDALLAINGRKIEGSDGSHRLRLTETQPLLGGDHFESPATMCHTGPAWLRFPTPRKQP